MYIINIESHERIGMESVMVIIYMKYILVYIGTLKIRIKYIQYIEINVIHSIMS